MAAAPICSSSEVREESAAPRPDPTQGVINGRVAVSFWPQGPEEPGQLLDPTLYEVHLTPASDLDQEFVYPAGTWFQPPPGSYRVWLEGKGNISPGSVILRYSGGRFRGRGLLTADAVFPGGTVYLDPTVQRGASTVLRLLHTESHNRAEYPQRELSRRLRAEALSKGATMPAGPVFAGLYDNAADEYVAVSRPVDVPAGGKVAVAPTPPKPGTTDLILVLERPVPVGSYDEYDVELTADDGESRRVPDVAVPTADRLYAVWYGLSGRAAAVTAASSSVFLDRLTIPLRPGRIERTHGRLHPLPDLEVGYLLPTELDKLEREVEVALLPGNQPIRTATLDSTTSSTTFSTLPAAQLEVTLRVGPWEFAEEADLRDGESGSIFFAPEPIEIGGTIFRGGRPHAASLRFRTGSSGQEVEIPTDPSGEYRAVLFRATYLAFIELDDVEGPPFVEMLNPPIDVSQKRDFRLPGNAYRVLVHGAETDLAIAGAQVDVRNEGEDGSTASQMTTSDREGHASLQPLRAGKVAVTVTADGYLPSEATVRQVLETDREVEIRVALEPEGETALVQFSLADGRAAAEAAVIVQQSPEASGELWAGHADARGEVAIPRRFSGSWLLVRHPSAGFRIGQWVAGTEAATWTLPPQLPLEIQTVNASGEPVAWADLALWVDGLRISGSTLAWLTSTSGSTDRNGYWRGSSIPARPLSVLAFTISGRTLANRGHLDALATDVDYPWPHPLLLEAYGDR